MIWFLPLIIIGGLFFPVLGYLVVGMMAFFLVFSFFKQRYWCWHLCPRGAFLDIVLSKISLKKPVPKMIARPWFRWMIFFLLMSFLSFRIVRTGGSPIAIGSVFIGTCLLTTVISIVSGIATKHRSWCVMCPMGLLQEKIGTSRKTIQKKLYSSDKNSK
ncbi:MAG: 4Fe-4S binding protein [Candidatus Aureabacteria bacterium]|nr:4Fe-4S binding protein [Candidatus Auribacterota bacterium]